jgi:hypothetical protein
MAFSNQKCKNQGPKAVHRKQLIVIKVEQSQEIICIILKDYYNIF